MCGRFTLFIPPGELVDEFDLDDLPSDYTPRYNIAPSQPVFIVRDSTSRIVEMYRWGLIPYWAKDPNIGYKMINSRAETVAEKPSFRNLIVNKRNIIFSTGFYEWMKIGSTKEPEFIHLKDERVFAFAGLWDEWLSPDGKKIRSTTIITCPANTLVVKYHDRMPVILDKENMWKWLDPTATPLQAQQMLLPFDPDRMISYPVSTLVNNPRVDTPELIQPIV
jgi:putative SOS response-associated peptidase YedK